MNFIKLNNQKRPLTKFHPKFYSDNYNQWNNVGFIIGNNIIVLDFDNDNENEKQIISYIEKNFPTLVVETTRGKHFYYKMPPDYKFQKSIDGLSCLGFQCDYLTGEKTIATIKLNGKLRKMNKEFNEDNMNVLPMELYPLRKAKKLSGLIDGSGRNNSLYAHLLSIRESFPEIDINTLADSINQNIFTKKLDNKELKEIVKSANKKQIKNTKKEIKYSSFKDLQAKNLPPVIYYVEKLIPQGLTLICSVPKIGKSWMALDIGISISNGMPILGFKTHKSGVLYLALEDSENRLQGRINNILKGKKAPDNFMYSIRCDDVNNGLIDELEDIKKKEPNINVIIIDTLQKVRSVYRGSNNYGNDYKEISQIKEFADKYNMSIILIHHLRKSNDGDSFDKVSGTNGITGTADTTIVLEKDNRDKKETILSVVGRDVEYNKYIVYFNQNEFKWELISSYEERQKEYEKDNYYNNPIIQVIRKNVAKNNGKWETTYKEIQEILFNEYSDLIDTTINSNRLKPLKEQLKKYDGISYMTFGPKNNKRPIVFKKVVDFVENVESNNTNNTNSTNNTKKDGDV